MSRIEKTVEIGTKGANVRRLCKLLCLVLLIQTSTHAQDSGEFKTIHEAAAAGNARGILVFIQRGVSVNAKDSNARTPLMSACEAGMSRVIPILLDRKADINAIDNGGNTALHLGAGNGHAKVITELINAGADASIQNGKGLTAKELAEKSGNSRAVSEFRSDSPYAGPYEREYQAPIVESNKLADALADPNEVRARLQADPNLVKDMVVLFKAMETEEAKWTSRTRRIKNTFFTVVRKEIDSEIVFIQKVAKQEDANDIVHELDVVQSTWKSIFSQSSRKMRDAARGVSAQGMQTTMRPSRSRGRRGQTTGTASSRRRTRPGSEEAAPEINPHQAYIDSWATASDTGLDTIYQSTQDKFLSDIGRVRVLADRGDKQRIVNAIDGVMLERTQRAERSLVVYGLTKAELTEAASTGMNEDTARGPRGRRGSTQSYQTGQRRR